MHILKILQINFILLQFQSIGTNGVYAWIYSFKKAGKEYPLQEDVRKFFPVFYTERLKSLRNHAQRFTGFSVVDSVKASNLPLE